MRRRVPGLVLLFTTWLAAGCNGCQTTLNQAHGSLELTPQILDFRTVCLHSTSEADLMLNNDGRGALTILSTSFSDPAFTLLADLPMTVSPHDTVIVRVGFTPSQAKDYSAFLTIKSDAPTDGTQKVTLLGTGFSGQNRDFEVSCDCASTAGSGLTCGVADGGINEQPCSFLSYESVVAGTTLQRTVTVKNLGCEPVMLTQALFSDTGDTDAGAAAAFESWFTFNPGDAGPNLPLLIRGGDTQSYDVQFNPPASAGQAEPQVVLQLISTDTTMIRPPQTVAGTWNIYLTANSIVPALQVSPGILTYFNATMGQPETQTFTISNTGSSTLQLDPLSLSGSGEFSLGALSSMTLAPFPGPGDTVTVNATFTPTSTGSASATVTVSAMGQQQKVELVGGSQPQLEVKWLDTAHAEQDPPVNWGMTQAGDTNDSRTVRLHNIGSADLTVTNIVARDLSNSQPSGSFQVSGFTPPVTVPSGQSTDVTVVFNDNITLRNDSGNLDVYSNDPGAAPNGGFTAVSLQTTNDPIFPPIPDVSVSAGPTTCQTLTLDGSGSSDPQGEMLTYKWAISVVPNGSHISLSTPTAARTAVVSQHCNGPDVPGSYVFTLTVDDSFPQNTATISQAVTVQ
jgi:hypothetical protein